MTTILYLSRVEFEKVTSWKTLLESSVGDMVRLNGGLDSIDFQENQIYVSDIGTNYRENNYIIRTTEGNINKLVNYVHEEAWQTNTHYSFYWNSSKQTYTHTVGSHEFRDKENKFVLSQRLGREVLTSKKDLKEDLFRILRNQ